MLEKYPQVILGRHILVAQFGIVVLDFHSHLVGLIILSFANLHVNFVAEVEGVLFGVVGDFDSIGSTSPRSSWGQSTLLSNLIRFQWWASDCYIVFLHPGIEKLLNILFDSEFLLEKAIENERPINPKIVNKINNIDKDYAVSLKSILFTIFTINNLLNHLIHSKCYVYKPNQKKDCQLTGREELVIFGTLPNKDAPYSVLD